MKSRSLSNSLMVAFVSAAFTIIGCSDDRQQDIPLTTGQEVRLDEQGIVTAQLTHGWFPLGSGILLMAGGEEGFLNSDLACLKGFLDIENHGSSTKTFPASFQLQYGNESEHVSVFLDENAKRKIRGELTVPGQRTTRIHLAPLCPDFEDLVKETPQIKHLASGTQWTLMKPEVHDIFYQEAGCDHFLHAEILDQKWSGLAAGTEVEFKGTKGEIKDDLAGIDITVKLHSRAGTDLYFRPPLYLVNDHDREIKSVSLDLNKEQPKIEKDGRIKVASGQSRTVYLSSRREGFSTLYQAGNLYLHSQRYGWKLALSPLPAYETLFEVR